VKKLREMFVTVVAAMIEAGEVPPPPASQGKRTEQVNVRLSAEEKLVLEASARRHGHAGWRSIFGQWQSQRGRRTREDELPNSLSHPHGFGAL